MMNFDMEICGSFRKVYKIKADSVADARREMERRWRDRLIEITEGDCYEAKVREAGTTWDDDGNSISTV